MPRTGRPKKATLVLTDDERSALLRLTKRARANRRWHFAPVSCWRAETAH